MESEDRLSASRTTPPASLLLAYGTAAVPAHVAAAMAAGTDDRISRPGAPVATLAPGSGRAIRLSDVTHPFTLPPMAQDLAHAETQVRFLEEHLAKLCGAFARPQAGFVATYFAALRSHVAERAEALAARAGALAGLVEPLHWCFAAPMPFPRAHVGLTPEGALASSDAGTIVQVDFLFQTADGLLACEAGASTPLGSRRRQLEALEAAGVRVERIAPGLAGAALLDRLGPGFAGFTDGISLPESPFRGRPIDAPA